MRYLYICATIKRFEKKGHAGFGAAEWTIAAIATPPGVGGIAVVRISGSGAYSVAEAVFRPKNPNKSLRAASGYTALFGLCGGRGAVRRGGSALLPRASQLYGRGCGGAFLATGGQRRERAPAARLLCGWRAPAGPGEFTKRAFLSGRISLTQAEAVMDLINATSRRPPLPPLPPWKERCTQR